MARTLKSKRKRAPKTILKLPDLEQSKSAVLNSLTSTSSQRSYDHAIREFIDWYCSEPRLAFNKTVVTRYRISLEQRQYPPSTINLRLAAVRRLTYEASDCGLLSPDLAAGIRRVPSIGTMPMIAESCCAAQLPLQAPCIWTVSAPNLPSLCWMSSTSTENGKPCSRASSTPTAKEPD